MVYGTDESAADRNQAHRRVASNSQATSTAANGAHQERAHGPRRLPGVPRAPPSHPSSAPLSSPHTCSYLTMAKIARTHPPDQQAHKGNRNAPRPPAFHVLEEGGMRPSPNAVQRTRPAAREARRQDKQSRTASSKARARAPPRTTEAAERAQRGPLPGALAPRGRGRRSPTHSIALRARRVGAQSCGHKTLIQYGLRFRRVNRGPTTKLEACGTQI